MSMLEVDDYARRLWHAHGDRAEYEAAQKARNAEDKGDRDTAAQWRQVREKIRILRGPNAS